MTMMSITTCGMLKIFLLRWLHATFFGHIRLLPDGSGCDANAR
jgi:hypothetical protein